MLRSIAGLIKSVLKRACGVNELHARLDELGALMNLYRGDLLTVLGIQQELSPNAGITVETDHPIAIKSDDHLFPRGTKNDNTRYPRFCRKCEEVFGRPLRFLDLGCSGGGLVFDFLLRGHLAVGLEGSDYSLRNQRAEWRVIPGNLFTCDITKPFKIKLRSGREDLKFDVISAWEVLEHIPEDALPRLLSNVVDHLAEDGLFVASVATFEDRDPGTGAVWHVTVRPRDWWLEKAGSAGLAPVAGIFDALDLPRAPGGMFSLNLDSKVEVDPGRGFHLILRRRAGDLTSA